jgi:hypothetical protein
LKSLNPLPRCHWNRESWPFQMKIWNFLANSRPYAKRL